MINAYNGKVYCQPPSRPPSKKSTYNGADLLAWVFSLLIALAPIYLLFIEYLDNNDGIIDKQFFFECFVIEDTLWVFCTVLLFVLLNGVIDFLKHGTPKAWVAVLMMIGAFVFVISEITWMYFNNNMSLDNPKYWAAWISVVLVIIICVISAPLQIYFSKGD